MDEAAQQDLNRREFAHQSQNFEAEGSLFRNALLQDRMTELIPVPDGARILDVAGGTGQTGRRLARDGDATAVILDLTDEMLAAGLKSVREEGRNDVTFVRGEATQLPFPDGQFEVVVCRFALHHMADPAAAIEEMKRVRAPGGTVTLLDMVNGGSRHDELERLRDPSHASALEQDELIRLLVGDAEPERFGELGFPMPLEPWLAQSHTPEPEAERLRELFAAEADGGEPTGLLAARDDEGALTITQRWVLVGD